jgi:hypothetical protein
MEMEWKATLRYVSCTVHLTLRTWVHASSRGAKLSGYAVTFTSEIRASPRYYYWLQDIGKYDVSEA